MIVHGCMYVYVMGTMAKTTHGLHIIQPYIIRPKYLSIYLVVSIILPLRCTFCWILDTARKDLKRPVSVP